MSVLKPLLSTGQDSSTGIASYTEGGAQRLERIQTLAHEKLSKVSEAHLSFSIGGKRIVVREAVLKTINAISKSKDIISLALSAEPHAALAWSGVMAILPVRSSFSTLTYDVRAQFFVLVPRKRISARYGRCERT